MMRLPGFHDWPHRYTLVYTRQAPRIPTLQFHSFWSASPLKHEISCCHACSVHKHSASARPLKVSPDARTHRRDPAGCWPCRRGGPPSPPGRWLPGRALGLGRLLSSASVAGPPRDRSSPCFLAALGACWLLAAVAGRCVVGTPGFMRTVPGLDAGDVPVRGPAGGELPPRVEPAGLRPALDAPARPDIRPPFFLAAAALRALAFSMARRRQFSSDSVMCTLMTRSA